MKYLTLGLMVLITTSSFAGTKSSECISSGKITSLTSYKSKNIQATLDYDDVRVVVRQGTSHYNIINTAYITNSIVCIKNGSSQINNKGLTSEYTVIYPEKLLVLRN